MIVASDTTEIGWSDAVKLIDKCQVQKIQINQGSSYNGLQIPESYIDLKNNQKMNINEFVSYSVAQQAVQEVSSTCGIISIGVSVYN